MTLKAIILGGTAAAALTCAGLATPSFAQTAPADQSAPAAAPSTPDATTSKDTMTSKPKHRMHHHHHKIHSARMSSHEEYAETRRLNQEQLAKAQGGAQGSYGTMEQQQPQAPAAVPPSNSNNPPPSDMNNAAPSNMNSPPPSDTNTPPPSAPNPPPKPKAGPY